MSASEALDRMLVVLTEGSSDTITSTSWCHACVAFHVSWAGVIDGVAVEVTGTGVTYHEAIAQIYETHARVVAQLYMYNPSRSFKNKGNN